MRRKILIAESTAAVRSVAEGILRQNGHEVISVSTAHEAHEAIERSLPDLIIVGADLKDASKSPLYESIQSSKNSSKIPLLLFETSDKSRGKIDFPEEVVIANPIDPREFLVKVNVFLGQGDAVKSSPNDPLAVSDVNDDFLDAALGLDRIDVTDSEELDKTAIGLKRSKSKPVTEDTVSEFGSDTGEIQNESSKVESLLIMDGSGPIKIPHNQDTPKPTIDGSGKLEILDDQFGLSSSIEPAEDAVHDYDWFVNSVKEENSTDFAAKQATGKGQKSADNSGGLSFVEPSETVDPITKGPGSSSGSSGSKDAVGVEKFIDEFKKEVELLHSSDSNESQDDVNAQMAAVSRDHLSWDEKLEKITSEDAGLFTREVAAQLAEKLSARIIAQINQEELLNLIKDEIRSLIREKH